MKNRNVIVTGGCGFIGINLTLELLDRGANITVLDLPSADWARLPAGVKTIKADILDGQSLSNAFDDIEIVYHLAARTDLDGRSLSDYKANFEGTENIINQLKGSKTIKKLVLYSTQLVVGLFNETRFIDETEPYRTNTVYGESKILAEKITIRKCSEFGIPYVIIRPTSVYGPWGKSPYREFFYAIKNRRYFHVGRANNLVSFAYVENLVDQTILLSLNDSANNQLFFGNDFHPYTMREVADAAACYYKVKIHTIPSPLVTVAAYAFGVLKLFGADVPIYPFRLKNIKANYCYDIQNSVRLGYDPKFGLKEGIIKTLDWYEKNEGRA
ncbi:MAG TPA: NAD(P)-dependent oxidoreductase [Blastocatellia bacterium]|jgi:nucleoside-diphosphate-sugar epimerase|nr:NAD(P)-dependent oxidoreductase [Blastocatellia bacterium]